MRFFFVAVAVLYFASCHILHLTITIPLYNTIFKTVECFVRNLTVYQKRKINGRECLLVNNTSDHCIQTKHQLLFSFVLLFFLSECKIERTTMNLMSVLYQKITNFKMRFLIWRSLMFTLHMQHANDKIHFISFQAFAFIIYVYELYLWNIHDISCSFGWIARAKPH